MLVDFIDPRPEVIHLPGLSRETGGRTQLGKGLENRLPSGAQVMIARIDREEKIRLAVVGPDPGAVQPNLDGHASDVDAGVALLFLEHIDQCLAGFRLRGQDADSCPSSHRIQPGQGRTRQQREPPPLGPAQKPAMPEAAEGVRACFSSCSPPARNVAGHRSEQLSPRKKLTCFAAVWFPGTLLKISPPHASRRAGVLS
jgi:hypothetical protein